MMKQTICLNCIMLSVLVASPVYAATQSQKLPWPTVNMNNHAATAGGSQDAANMATQVSNSFLNNIFNSTNRPAWLTRTDIDYSIAHNHTPTGSIETIQPFNDSIMNTLFWQGRAAYAEEGTTFNLGLGYRHLTWDKKILWGINAFYDESVRYLHKRVGLGGEFFTPYVTLRANYYDAISGNRLTSRVNNAYERALDGFDASIETPVPHVSWMRLVAQGYHWEGVNTTNVNGGALSFRIFPARQLEVDLGVADDNNLHGQAFLKLAYYLGSPAFIQNSATTPHSTDTYAAQNLEDMRLEKVIRHNDIVVEKTIGTPGTTAIVIARGT